MGRSSTTNAPDSPQADHDPVAASTASDSDAIGASAIPIEGAAATPGNSQLQDSTPIAFVFPDGAPKLFADDAARLQSLPERAPSLAHNRCETNAHQIPSPMPQADEDAESGLLPPPEDAEFIYGIECGDSSDRRLGSGKVKHKSFTMPCDPSYLSFESKPPPLFDRKSGAAICEQNAWEPPPLLSQAKKSDIAQSAD